jgi:hypothetical protein
METVKKKIILPSLIIMFLLSSCGISEGSDFKVKTPMIGTDTEEDFMQLSTKTGDDGNLEIDGKTVIPLFEGTRIEVMKVSKYKKDNLLMVKELDGAYKGRIIWVSETDLKDKAESVK